MSKTLFPFLSRSIESEISNVGCIYCGCNQFAIQVFKDEMFAVCVKCKKNYSVLGLVEACKECKTTTQKGSTT